MSTWWHWVRFINVKMKKKGVKPSRYQQRSWRLFFFFFQARTHSHHPCGVWLWAFPSSSHLAAAEFCLSSASPIPPPSSPPSPPEWGSIPRSWWFLKKGHKLARRSSEEGTITEAVIAKAFPRFLLLSLIFFSSFISFSGLRNRSEGKLEERQRKTKMEAVEEEKPSRKTYSKQTFSNKAICQTHIPLLLTQLSLMAAHYNWNVLLREHLSDRRGWHRLALRKNTSAFIRNQLVWAW